MKAYYIRILLFSFLVLFIFQFFTPIFNKIYIDDDIKIASNANFVSTSSGKTYEKETLNMTKVIVLGVGIIMFVVFAVHMPAKYVHKFIQKVFQPDFKSYKQPNPTIFDLILTVPFSFIVIIIVHIIYIMSTSDLIHETANIRRTSCYENIRVIQDAVEAYNKKYKKNPMKELDISLLIKKGYLKNELQCSATNKNNYTSIGDLSKDGFVSCGKTLEDNFTYHGIATDPTNLSEEFFKSLTDDDYKDMVK